MAASGNNLDTVRRHNLATVVELVHRSGGLSRARLTALTGLNRSTVAALTAELVALGLAVEDEPAQTKRVGRPSPLVRPHHGAVAFAVNPEVDAVTVAVVGLDAEVRAQRCHEFDAPPSAEDAVSITAALVRELTGQLSPDALVLGLGVAVPGLVRSTDGVVRLAPHLGWESVPLAHMLGDATGLSCWVGNDASLGAVAEQSFGSGDGVSDLVYLNGGASGIGGGIIADGELLGGTGGFAGEFGHTRVAGTTSRGGTLEDEVNRARLREVLDVVPGGPDDFERAISRAHDGEAAREVARQVDVLSAALRNVINMLNPALVVLGGFLGMLFDAHAEQMRRLVGLQTLGPAFEDVRIVRAGLGEEILLIGAAELVFTRILDDPSGAVRDARRRSR